MAKLKTEIRDYVSAREYLRLPATFDPQDSSLTTDRALGHNTRLSLTTAGVAEGSIAVWLHSTAVVRFYADGSVRLDSGGWRTMTTANRIRQTLPVGFDLENRDGAWFIEDNRPNRFPPREAMFRDCMTIDTATKGNPFRG